MNVFDFYSANSMNQWSADRNIFFLSIIMIYLVIHLNFSSFLWQSRAGHLSLEIPCTELEDTGDYLVDVRNEQGRINSSCYIQIERKSYLMF